MAGSLTLGGMADNLPAGGFLVGPVTVSGTKSTPEIMNIELTSGVALKVPLPPEARQWAVFFQFAGAAPGEVFIECGTVEMGIPARDFACSPIPAGVTEMYFFAASAPKLFQLVVI